MSKAKIFYFTLQDEQTKEEKLDWFDHITPDQKVNSINLTNKVLTRISLLSNRPASGVDSTLAGDRNPIIQFVRHSLQLTLHC